MYNLFQYANLYRERKQVNKHQQLQQQFHARHEEFKSDSFYKLKERAEDFLFTQRVSNEPPFFLGNSSVKMSKSPSFGTTVRSKLIDSDRFEKDFGNHARSTRNKSYSIYNNSRQKGQNPHQMLLKQFQPSQRATNSLQLQKINIKAYDKNVSNFESSKPITEFDHSFNKLYKEFQHSKSKLLKVRKETLGKYENRLYNQTKKYKEQNVKRESRLEKFSVNPEEGSPSAVNNSYNDQKCKEKRQTKVYFKLAKTMQMFHPEVRMRQEFQSLLKKTNYSVDKKIHKMSHSYCE